ncbi:MAG: AzlD domain-containing protein [Segniliparus sp.]|uniref:AzlD domain-containing protein n=1 Tax=Segniliparus sp. TaxID=2804064 RepID=UPI003F32019A
MTFAIILMMGLVAFALRFSFLASPQNKPSSALFQRALYYVLPSVLVALIAQEVFIDGQGALRSFPNPYLLGAAAGFSVGIVKRQGFFLVFGLSVAVFALAKAFLK